MAGESSTDNIDSCEVVGADSGDVGVEDWITDSPISWSVFAGRPASTRVRFPLLVMLRGSKAGTKDALGVGVDLDLPGRLDASASEAFIESSDPAEEAANGQHHSPDSDAGKIGICRVTPRPPR